MFHVANTFMYTGPIPTDGFLHDNNFKAVLSCKACEIKTPLAGPWLVVALHDQADFDINRYFKKTTDFLLMCGSLRLKTYIHCQHGIHRSAYLIYIQQTLSVGEALQLAGGNISNTFAHHLLTWMINPNRRILNWHYYQPSTSRTCK